MDLHALAIATLLLSSALQVGQPLPGRSEMSPSAQITEAPSPAKLRLIRRFMALTGLQQEIELGSFLYRHALPGGSMWRDPPSSTGVTTLRNSIDERVAALRRAYERHRSTYQQEYESHLNWEFTETELEEIVAFLERPVGQHYLDGSWRMNAYVGTNVEQLEEQIVREAIASLER